MSPGFKRADTRHESNDDLLKAQVWMRCCGKPVQDERGGARCKGERVYLPLATLAVQGKAARSGWRFAFIIQPTSSPQGLWTESRIRPISKVVRTFLSVFQGYEVCLCVGDVNGSCRLRFRARLIHLLPFQIEILKQAQQANCLIPSSALKCSRSPSWFVSLSRFPFDCHYSWHINGEHWVQE